MLEANKHVLMFTARSGPLATHIDTSSLATKITTLDNGLTVATETNPNLAKLLQFGVLDRCQEAGAENVRNNGVAPFPRTHGLQGHAKSDRSAIWNSLSKILAHT